MARKKQKPEGQPTPTSLDEPKLYFATTKIDKQNVSYEIFALVHLLRFIVSPVRDKSGNPYTHEPVKFAMKVVAACLGRPYEGYDWLEALDDLDHI